MTTQHTPEPTWPEQLAAIAVCTACKLIHTKSSYWIRKSYGVGAQKRQRKNGLNIQAKTCRNLTKNILKLLQSRFFVWLCGCDGWRELVNLGVM